MGRVKVGLLAALLAAAGSGIVKADVLYQTDFSSDPGWTTDRPSDYYWDSTNEAYNLTVRNETPAGQPANYYYKLLSQSVSSFTLTWDQKITEQQWPCNIQFGLSDSSLGYNGSGQSFMSVWGVADQGYHMELYAYGASGLSLGAGPYNVWTLNQWYTCAITYNSDIKTASYSVKKQGDSTSICSFNLAVPGGITSDLKYLGTSNDFGGYFGNAVDRGLIDNVSLKGTQLKTLSGVPEYERRRGCSPTSATMLMAYWSQNGYANLWNGTPPTSNDPSNHSDPVNVVIEHVGDLMGTSSAASGGSTDPSRIPSGMIAYAKEKDSSYDFKAGNKYASDTLWHPGSWFEGFSLEYLKHEVDAGRPMHVGLKLKVSGDAVGHSVVAYGYQDNPGTDNDWIAVQDTWVDGGNTGGYAITNKVESGTEWWKWVTDTSQDYYIYRGGWLIPSATSHGVWGLMESRFESTTAFSEQFSVTKTSSGSAELATLTGAPQESVLRIHSVGTQGVDDCLVSSILPGTDVINLSLKYAFETPGTLDILLGGHLLAALVDPVGLGTVDDPTDFLAFSQEFALADYGLSPDESYELVLRLLAGSEHTLFLDDLQITDPAASPIPEPASFSLLILGGVALMARRRGRK